MKNIIVVFLGGYLPSRKYGGPVTSIYNFSEHLGEKYRIKIVCGDHDFKESNILPGIKDGWNQVGKAKVYYIPDKEFTRARFAEIIEPFRDEIAMFYLSGIYFIRMNYEVIRLGNAWGIPLVLAPRGDLMKNTIAMKSKAKMVKKLVFLKLMRAMKVFKGVIFQSTSEEETAGLHHYLGVDDAHIYELPNLPVPQHIRNRYFKEKNRVKIVFVSRLMVKKNPLLALDAVKQIRDDILVTFHLYGPNEDQEYWNLCEDKIREINQSRKNIHVEYRGSLEPFEAKSVYDKYDCFLFPTLSENYGHVIVESMLADCPVILSKNTTPWDDYHSHGGFIIPLDDVAEFTRALEKVAEMDQSDYDALLESNREYVEKKFKTEKLVAQYVTMIDKVSHAISG